MVKENGGGGSWREGRLGQAPASGPGVAGAGSSRVFAAALGGSGYLSIVLEKCIASMFFFFRRVRRESVSSVSNKL